MCLGGLNSEPFQFRDRGEENTKVHKNLRIAADSTMLRIVNLLIALSLGVHLEQLEHRIGFTWPLPFLFRPLQISHTSHQTVLLTISSSHWEE